MVYVDENAQHGAGREMPLLPVRPGLFLWRHARQAQADDSRVVAQRLVE